MTSPTQRAGADVVAYCITGRDFELEEDDSPTDSSLVSYADYAALQARIAELEARNAASERDAGRYRWLRECSSVRSDRNMYVQRNNYEQGKFCGTDFPSGDQLDDVIDAAIDAHAQGQA